ncbi:MAG: alkane 1-monooxygenase [Mycobacterium sp.]
MAADHGASECSGWRQLKRYLWLCGAIAPGLGGLSWLAVQLTGSAAFWWFGLVLTLGILPVLDRILGPDRANPSDSALEWLQDDPFYRWVTYLYLPGQYLSLAFACWLWSGGGWLAMSFVDRAGLMVTTGIVGGIAINAAHELGHRRTKLEKRLSKLALAQTGYGHFFVEHNLGHHTRVATPQDAASARFGESLYRFIPRSVFGGLRSAWRIETRRLARSGRGRLSPRNDILNAWLLTIALFAVLVAWFGVVVLPWLIGQAIIGFSLLETVNYLEHYGLRRQQLTDGRYERVGPAHSWNSNTVVMNVFLFHLQRHSDHHANPQRRYQALRDADGAPQLPAGYGTMMVLALIPPLWRRVMDRRVVAHYRGDAGLVAWSPAALARRAQQVAVRDPAVPGAGVGAH